MMTTEGKDDNVNTKLSLKAIKYFTAPEMLCFNDNPRLASMTFMRSTFSSIYFCSFHGFKKHIMADPIFFFVCIIDASTNDAVQHKLPRS